MPIHIGEDQARRYLPKLLKEVVDDRETIIIDRPGAEGVALIAADELSSLLETIHLFRSPKNAERLLAAFNRSRARNTAPQTVEELRAEVGLEPKKAK